MGRGRAKAKQVKVARQLKYSGGGMDLDRLRAEIGSEQTDDERFAAHRHGGDGHDGDGFDEDEPGGDSGDD